MTLYRLVVDTMPLTHNPLEAKDYSSEMILGLLYRPLFEFDARGQLVSNFFTEMTFLDSLTLRLKVSQRCWWQTGERVTSQDIARFLDFSKAGEYGYYLDFLKQVIVEGEESLLVIFNYQCPDYQKVLASGIFSLLRIEDGKPNLSAYSGAFSCISWGDTEVKLGNGVHVLSFSLQGSVEGAVQDFEQGLVDMTATTNFPLGRYDTYKSKSSFYQQSSSISLSFIFGDKLIDYKYDFAKQIGKAIGQDCQLSKAIVVDDNYSVDSSNSMQESDLRSIQALCPDYYPNHMIMNKVKQYFGALGVEVNVIYKAMADYMVADRSDYDLVLSLHKSRVETEIENFLLERQYLESRYISPYNALLQTYVDCPTVSNQRRVANFLMAHSHQLTLGKLNYLYLKSTALTSLYVDVQGVLKWQEGL